MELNLSKKEEEILDFWEKNKIFEKSLEKTKDKPKFVFYEGPPFANGLPGIHHLLVRAFKDVILRYKTMQGFSVKRKAGWDTHGLPTEMSAEKKLKINSKKEIEKDIGGFIEECKNNIFLYKKEWEEFTRRIGYWLDLKNPYITCSDEYIETLWWILKQIWEKGLLFQDYKVVPYCPRCGTSLSSHEVAQGYKTVRENSVYVKFPVKKEKNTYFLVWTTTPWTLPGNVAIAVNPELSYLKVKTGNEYLYLAKERISAIGDGYDEISEEIKGKDLIGKEYDPIFDFTKPDKKAYYLVAGDFVSTQEGTGLVHIAPAFGEDDMIVGQKNNLPIILNVDEEGKFKEEVKPWEGKFVKDADPLIIKELKEKNILFKEESCEHEYPFCWRCDSPLLYYAKQSWFIKTTAIKDKLIENNKKINWVPEYLKEGRFGEWLKDVKDWNLSRERYWGTPLPIWQCEKCDKNICIGSIKELEEKKESFSEIKNLHRPQIDEVILKCECGGKMKRVKEVIDCWFDSGAMPFAQSHYPFENKELIDKKEFFPADFICEGVDQTRGWFYTLLAISTLLGFESPYKNVVSTGLVLDGKGKKMSKSKGNVVVPSDIIDKYGADVARFYFYTINSVGDPKKFDFNDIQSLYRRFFDTLINSRKFFDLYAKKGFKHKKDFKTDNLLDKWILSSLESLNIKIIEKLDNYDIVGAARLFEDFVDDLSNWYIRRSRKRLQKPENNQEKEEASQTLYYVLLKLSLLLAPFVPFSAESAYQDLNGEKESIHLEDYPLPKKELIDEKLEGKMKKTREIIASALAERAKSGIKVRQPLKELIITDSDLEKEQELLGLIKEEVNVKKIGFGEVLHLDIEISSELKEEGMIREIIHNIQEIRKRAGLKPEDEISVGYSGNPELEKFLDENKKSILKEARIKGMFKGEGGSFDSEKTIKVENKELNLTIKKIN
ncbi:MAG: isoleucine--tRNA ligase [Candidatus Nealsonbacteria bacterium]|nr:isoleucine--tRNA ligase [Candidatus Nealsonbacteria bacterium]